MVEEYDLLDYENALIEEYTNGNYSIGQLERELETLASITMFMCEHSPDLKIAKTKAIEKSIKILQFQN